MFEGDPRRLTGARFGFGMERWLMNTRKGGRTRFGCRKDENVCNFTQHMRDERLFACKNVGSQTNYFGC